MPCLFSFHPLTIYGLQVRKLTAERDEREKELTTLLAKRPTDLWMEDLDRFVEAYKLSLVGVALGWRVGGESERESEREMILLAYSKPLRLYLVFRSCLQLLILSIQIEEAENAADVQRMAAKQKGGKKAAQKRAHARGSDDEEEDYGDDWKPSKVKKAAAKKTPAATAASAAPAVSATLKTTAAAAKATAVQSTIAALPRPATVTEPAVTAKVAEAKPATDVAAKPAKEPASKPGKDKAAPVKHTMEHSPVKAVWMCSVVAPHMLVACRCRKRPRSWHFIRMTRAKKRALSWTATAMRCT